MADDRPRGAVVPPRPVIARIDAPHIARLTTHHVGVSGQWWPHLSLCALVCPRAVRRTGHPWRCALHVRRTAHTAPHPAPRTRPTACYNTPCVTPCVLSRGAVAAPRSAQ